MKEILLKGLNVCGGLWHRFQDSPFRKGLAFKFAAFSLLAVVLPALTVAGSLLLIGRRALTESIYAQQSETAHRITDRILVHVQNVRSVLAIAATEPGLAALPRARQEETLRRLLRWQSTFKEGIVLNAAGMEAAKVTSKGNRFLSNPLLISRASRPEFLLPAREGKLFVSPPFFAGDRLPYIMVSAPTYGRRAVLAARVTLENIWDLVKEVREGQPGIAYIVDQKGVLIAHPDAARVQMHTSLEKLSIIQAFQAGKAGRASFGVHRNERGEKVVALVQTVPDLGWGVVMEIPIRAAYAPIRQMYRQVFFWTLLSVLLILGVAFWRVRRIVSPITILREGAEKIARGKLDLKLDISTGDELEQLALTFERMAGSLKALEEMRRDLISMIVHDLKSPLSGIIGAIDYVLESKESENLAGVRRVLTLAHRSADDLFAMVQNLLDVSKMEEGKLELQAEAVEIAPLLQECAENFKVQVERESKQLEVSCAAGLPAAAIDRPLVRRVLTNLISNAIRHTSSGGQIDLGARLSDGGLEIVVQDNGDGIPPEYRDKIFDKFVQAERKRAHLRTGTGLGLTFCKMAIELHGGTIRVESEVGKGSAFKFLLPLSRETEPLPAAL